jgi:hypothetical protein
MARHLWLLAISLISAATDRAITAQTLHREPPVRVFTALGLTQDEMSAVDAGRPVAKVLSWGTPSEVYVFGAVHVEAAPASYIRTVRDIAHLTTTPGYLGLGELRSDATVEDVAARDGAARRSSRTAPIFAGVSNRYTSRCG